MFRGLCKALTACWRQELSLVEKLLVDEVGGLVVPSREELDPLNFDTVLSQPSLALSIVRHGALQA